jgi:aerobic carbon-monoxide dehydrogenase medium subunit
VKPVDFAYARPASLAAALELIADERRGAKLLAGGQSLGPMLNLRLARPAMLVDITGLDELRTYEARENEIAIGACITHSDIEDGRLPDVTGGAMRSVACGIAYRAVRNRGTLGGSLAHADPAADWVALLTALGGRVELRSAAGARTLAVEDFVVGALEADLRPGEILVRAFAPSLGARARWGYYKACRKPGELAHAIGAVLIDPERKINRAVIAATNSRPIVIPDAAALFDGRGGFDAAGAEALAEARGLSDPIARRTHIVALRRALDRARSA